MCMGKFKAVFFDLGGTLVKTADAPEIFRRILEAHGVTVKLGSIAEAHRAKTNEFDVREMAKLGMSFWIEWNMKILERVGVQENKEFLAKKIDEQWFEYADLEMFSDVVETLVQLKARGIKLGIITNGFRRDFQLILEKFGLAGYFDVVVGADTLRRAKPDEGVFLCAIGRVGIKPEETLFIGDSVESDYRGVGKAGLKPLLIDRDRKTSENVERIESLTEILSYV